MTCHRALLLAWINCLALGSLNAEQTASETAEMAEARQTGVTILQLMQENLKDHDQAEFPGIQAWLKKEGKVLGALDKEQPDASWRNLNGDKLITRSPNFWQLYYEVVPGDPGLAMLHAGSLLAAGDADRAQTVLRLTLHRGDLDKKTVEILTGIIQHCDAFMRPSHALVNEGIKLHDRGDHAGALAKYDAALQLWPLNGWAAYERGTTLRLRDGEGPAVDKAFAQSRRIQPFQFNAWQGTVSEIPGLVNMHKVVSPLWGKSLKSIRYEMSERELEEMSEALQGAEIDDLALATRQIRIIRRGRYMPEDHPFIWRSLRRLVPGKQTETTLEKLAEPGLTAIQILKAPVPGKQ